VNRAQLVDILDILKPALAGNTPVQLYTCYCFVKDKVYAYNDRVAIVAPCKVNMTCALHGGTLYGWLKNSNADDADFDLTGNEVVLTAGKSKIKLPYHEMGDLLFEGVQDKDKDNKWLVTADVDEALLAGLEVCTSTTSRDLTQMALTCVYLMPGKLSYFYSSDSDSLTRYLVTAKATEQGTFAIPNNFCEEVVKLATRFKGEEGLLKATLSVNDDWARVRFENGVTVWGRILDVPSPIDFAAMLKSKEKGMPPAVPLPQGLQEALARACVLADPESKPTEFTIKGNKLGMFTQSSMGEATESLLIRGKHPDAEALVSAQLVARAIKACDEFSIAPSGTLYRNGNSLLQFVANMG